MSDGQHEEKLSEQTIEQNQSKTPMDLKRMLTIAGISFLTFCCCIMFFFVIYRYNGLADLWKEVISILQPIIIGLVLAYLLNPIMKFLEHHLLNFLQPRVKNKEKSARLIRYISIFGALLFLILVIVLLMAAVIPAMIDSITSIFSSLPQEVNNLIAWINDVAAGDSELADIAESSIKQATVFLGNWWTNTVIPQAQRYIGSIISGGISVVNFLIDILVGFIVSIYVLASKEKFAGQAKKMIYAIFKPGQANVIVHMVRKSNQIFGGFISGKLLDSAIIGVLAYMVLLIMKMPDPVLIAVIIGVTNVIPFFGPFIGAIPSFLLIVLQDPLKGVYFLIFIIILQQIDGNIIGPKILGNSTGLSPFWVVFSILLFGGLWGFAGMLLGVPLMAVIQYLVGQLISRRLKNCGIPDTEVDYENLYKINKDTNKAEYIRLDKNGKPDKTQKSEVEMGIISNKKEESEK